MEYTDPVRYGGDTNTHKKLFERARDIWRVRNPLDEDFKVVWEGRATVVKAGKTKDMEFFLVEKYFREISAYIIGQKAIQMGNDLKVKKLKANSNIMMSKYVENLEVWDLVPRQDDPVLVKELAKDIILGVVERYGENTEPVEQPKGNVMERLDAFDLALKDYEGVRVDASEESQKPLKEPFVKQATAEEVTSDER